MDINKTKKALAIVKALAYTENGGHPNSNKPVKGKTGETKSIFQFTPDTWKLYSKQILGNENAPLNKENEAVVVFHKVSDWLDKGYDTNQIASMWNAGEQKPDAYRQNWKGTNKKYGIAFDTPEYAKKVANYAQQFENESNSTSKKPEYGAKNNPQQPIIPPVASQQGLPVSTLPQLFQAQQPKV